ncbi:MAG: hypothetical protein GY814_08045 [Gammaproteobacteria bacterium]|nr:hypothetical protein [Gammaproteobacteria bacterium]
MKQLLNLLLATSLTLTLFSTSADTLLIDAISKAPANSPSELPRPINGETMDMVHTQFGNPVKKLNAIGTPPITRWVYDRFTVYFEYNRVVNSAVHLAPAE